MSTKPGTTHVPWASTTSGQPVSSSSSVVTTATRPSRTPRFLIAEGEPDWLSVAEVSARLETDLYVVALGLVAMSGNFPPEAAALLDGAECVVCVMDRGRQPADPAEWPGGVKMVERVRGWMLHEARRRRVPFHHAWEDVSRRLRVSLQDDDHDINDMHRAGELEGLLVRLLDGFI